MASLGSAARVHHAATGSALCLGTRRCFHSARAVYRQAAVRKDDKSFSGKIVLKGPKFGAKRRQEPDGLVIQSVRSARTLNLDRPDHGNALTPALMRALRSQLKTSNRDIDATRVIVLRPKPTALDMRAARREYPRRDFCVGDDRMVNIIPAYVREQYELLNDLHCSRPVVAFMEGMAHDAGAALALNCFFRVASTSTNICVNGRNQRPCMHGGVAGVLSKLDFNLGTYLALTGAPLRAADAFHAGLATVYVPHERVRMLQDYLMYLRTTTLDTVAAALNEHAAIPEPFTLQPHLESIERCFAHRTVEDIRIALEKEDSDFARGALRAMEQRSPLALKLSLRQLVVGSTVDPQECLRMGFRVWSNAAKYANGPEARAETLDAITDDVVQNYFVPLPRDQELSLPAALPWEERMEQRVLSLDDVALTRILEHYGPETLENYREQTGEVHHEHGDEAAAESKSEFAAVLHALDTSPALPPYGPLLLSEVRRTADEIESDDYEDLARKLNTRLNVPGNQDRLQMFASMLVQEAASGNQEPQEDNFDHLQS